MWTWLKERTAAAAAVKPLQPCLTLCDPIHGSPPGSPVPGILQARTLEWVAIAFSGTSLGHSTKKSLDERKSGLPWWLRGKESDCNAGDTGLIPGLGRSSRGGNGSPLQYSCLKSPRDRGAWSATVHRDHKELDTTEYRARVLRSVLPSAGLGRSTAVTSGKTEVTLGPSPLPPLGRGRYLTHYGKVNAVT